MVAGEKDARAGWQLKFLLPRVLRLSQEGRNAQSQARSGRLNSDKRLRIGESTPQRAVRVERFFPRRWPRPEKWKLLSTRLLAIVQGPAAQRSGCGPKTPLPLHNATLMASGHGREDGQEEGLLRLRPRLLKEKGFGGQRGNRDHRWLLGRADSSPRRFCWLLRLLFEPQSLASRAKGLGIEDPSADAVLPRLARLSQARAASRGEMRENDPATATLNHLKFHAAKATESSHGRDNAKNALAILISFPPPARDLPHSTASLDNTTGWFGASGNFARVGA
ncbi:hypothetical protein CPLU01_14568 [Colletotrichum plurivorum]|uniref:Uncharacterized protein n=1 Tax=Colletotrichum plurivorum TaxID=2175906 RepID=A0A8H6MZA1_9PEZI|nr:hypothetical protein CPLU01_14568 [Colletotrichum plurivorum]